MPLLLETLTEHDKSLLQQLKQQQTHVSSENDAKSEVNSSTEQRLIVISRHYNIQL